MGVPWPSGPSGLRRAVMLPTLSGQTALWVYPQRKEETQPITFDGEDARSLLTSPEPLFVDVTVGYESRYRRPYITHVAFRVDKPSGLQGGTTIRIERQDGT